MEKMGGRIDGKRASCLSTQRIDRLRSFGTYIRSIFRLQKIVQLDIGT